MHGIWVIIHVLCGILGMLTAGGLLDLFYNPNTPIRSAFTFPAGIIGGFLIAGSGHGSLLAAYVGTLLACAISVTITMARVHVRNRSS